jgi:uncharacterized membrane protein YdjX (TVP38/TMEM64 family)
MRSFLSIIFSVVATLFILNMFVEINSIVFYLTVILVVILILIRYLLIRRINSKYHRKNDND